MIFFQILHIKKNIAYDFPVKFYFSLIREIYNSRLPKVAFSHLNKFHKDPLLGEKIGSP